MADGKISHPSYSSLTGKRRVRSSRNLAVQQNAGVGVGRAQRQKVHRCPRHRRSMEGCSGTPPGLRSRRTLNELQFPTMNLMNNIWAMGREVFAITKFYIETIVLKIRWKPSFCLSFHFIFSVAALSTCLAAHLRLRTSNPQFGCTIHGRVSHDLSAGL